ncbi:hypothetical protein MED121_01515 [Marinomonas sp. MED121]|uniref:hypothetical protein n=1 Tax=Marinomonas sp. MED121 TaxID=314277 RepID=UPI0000690AF3|nr:hypothetical protein [Marinomonas sp. MED121]EAQ65848.1 hypothetical protein MED121_01515 [Marinomonas sp. MED121]
MSLSALQTAIQNAQIAYQEKEKEIQSYQDEKITQSIRLKKLGTQVTYKEKELKGALTQPAAETLTAECNALKEQYQACETLISNIENYLKNKANNDKVAASEVVKRAEQDLLKFVHKGIKSQLSTLAAEQEMLMRDYVVISEMISGSFPPGTRRSRYLGLVFDDLYGSLAGASFKEHQEKMMTKYLTPMT